MKNLTLTVYDNATEKRKGNALRVCTNQEENAKDLARRLISKKINACAWIKSIKASHNFEQRFITVVQSNGVIEVFAYDYTV